MSGAGAQAGLGPWRALCFLLAALVLVLADAAQPEWALARFNRQRVLPVARVVQARAAQLAGAADRALNARLGVDLSAWLTAQNQAGGGEQRDAE